MQLLPNATTRPLANQTSIPTLHKKTLTSTKPTHDPKEKRHNPTNHIAAITPSQYPRQGLGYQTEDILKR